MGVISRLQMNFRITLGVSSRCARNPRSENGAGAGKAERPREDNPCGVSPSLEAPSKRREMAQVVAQQGPSASGHALPEKKGEKDLDSVVWYGGDTIRRAEARGVR